MYEHESDILVAESEEELNENITDSISEKSAQSDDLIDVSYKPQPEQYKEKKQKDVFTNYNFNHLNKVYKKYDVVQTYVPKKQKEKSSSNFEQFVEEQDEYSPQKETLSVEKTYQKPIFKLKRKAKAWLVCFATIVIMLSSLCVINAVNINNLNKQIEQTTTSITDVNKAIQTTIKDIGKLTDEQEIQNNASELGLSEVDVKNNIEIELNDKNLVEDYQGQTNFFDKICNILRNMFGG